MTYSPDTLALNPDFARQRKRSRAKTPGGKGRYGSVPDAQKYEVQTTSHPILCRSNARTCYKILSAHVGKLDDVEMERRLAAALVALGRVMSDM